MITCTESEDVKFTPKLRGSICAQIAQPPLENRLIALFDFNESDTHPVFTSGNDTAGGRDFRACMNDSDPDLLGIENYEAFLQRRRELVTKRLNQFLGI